MIKHKKLLNENFFTIILIILSTSLFQFVDIISALISIFISYILFKLYLKIKNFKVIINIFKFTILPYIIIESVAIFMLFDSDSKLSVWALICTFFVIIKMSLISNNNLKYIINLILLYSVIFITILSFSLFSSRNIVEFSFLDNGNVIYLILSILFLSIASNEIYSFTNKTVNYGFLIGGVIYILFVILMNATIGNKYIFDTHPIIKISELVPFNISPFSEWFIMLLVCFRETIYFKFAYINFKRLRRQNL